MERAGACEPGTAGAVVSQSVQNNAINASAIDEQGKRRAELSVEGTARISLGV